MVRYMSLDVGEARIGVAVSDFSGFLASPYTTMHISRSQTEAQTFAEIQRLIAETEAEALVVGLPVSLDGQLHAQAKRILAFAERLKPSIAIPLTFWDERLSTVEATRLLTERGQGEGGKGGKGGKGRNQHGGRGGKSGKGGQGQRAKRRHPRQEIDALAATVILQEYLDSLGHPGRTEEVES